MKQYADKEAVFALLDEMGIPYHKQEHEAVHTMAEVESAGVVREGIVLKNLFLKDAKGKHHFLVCVPETATIDFRELGDQLGVKQLGMASAARLEKYLGVVSGCVSPLNILNDEDHEVVIVLDGTLSDETVVGIHPNDSAASVWLEYRYLKQLLVQQTREVMYLNFD